MCTMDWVVERLECPTLGAVAPPDGKSKARDRGSSVYESQNWDALDGELA